MSTFFEVFQQSPSMNASSMLAAAAAATVFAAGVSLSVAAAVVSFSVMVVGGAEGDVREVAEAFVNNTLKVRENFRCSHHDHGEGHDCGSHGEGHTCGEHGCGGGNCQH